MTAFVFVMFAMCGFAILETLDELYEADDYDRPELYVELAKFTGLLMWAAWLLNSATH